MAERVHGIISGFDRTKVPYETPGDKDPRSYILGNVKIKDSLFTSMFVKGSYEMQRDRMVLETRFNQKPGKSVASQFLPDAAVSLESEDNNSITIQRQANGNYLVLYSRPTEEGDTMETFSAIVRIESNGFSITSAANTTRFDSFSKGYKAHMEMSDKVGNAFYEVSPLPLPDVECAIISPEAVYAGLPDSD